MAEKEIVPDSIEHRFEQFGPKYRYLVTFAGMLGVMSMVLSVTIVNVAVPSVMGAYGIGQDPVDGNCVHRHDDAEPVAE